MRYSTITQIEKELNSKIEENIRIKTTVDVLNKRLLKERLMIKKKIQSQTTEIDEEGHDMGIDMRNSLEMSEE